MRLMLIWSHRKSPPAPSFPNFYSCLFQFSWRLKQMESVVDGPSVNESFFGGGGRGERCNISSQTIAPPLQRWWPSTPRQRSRKTQRTNPSREKSSRKMATCGGRQGGGRLYSCTPRYSHNGDHTMARRPILCPAVKMKPYSVLCRPSVSLLKTKNKRLSGIETYSLLCALAVDGSELNGLSERRELSQRKHTVIDSRPVKWAKSTI